MSPRNIHRSITTAALLSLLAFGCGTGADEPGPGAGPDGKADGSMPDASVPDPDVLPPITGQDLDLEWSAWPVPPIAPPTSQYQVQNGVVRDTLTGLEWQQEVGNAMYYPSAEPYCESLALDGGGWRLPTLIELLSLVDYSTYAPTINTDAFPNTPGYHYATSTIAYGTTYHHTAYFQLGYTGRAAPTDYDAVRCVRSPNNHVPNPSGGAPANRYTISDTTVLDNVTGLRWQRETPATEYSWSDAAAYCDSLQLDGGGWRLPTIKELQTLVDARSWHPTIDLDAFPDTVPDFYVSSTPAAHEPTKPWRLDFNSARTYTGNADSTFNVRCVK